MSLELAISANTAALQALTEAWSKLTRNAVTAAGIAAPELKVGGVLLDANKVSAVATASAGAVAKAAKTAAAVAKPEPVAADPVAEAIAYPVVGAAITAFAGANGRDATLALLGKLGVESGKALKPHQFAEALALFTQEEAVA